MTKNTKVLVLYDYFDPAYKAGGPIRSIVNMVKLLESQMQFYILTTNQDHDGSVLPVEADRWINYGDSSHVRYLSPGTRTYSNLKQIISELQPDTVYINGIYSLLFTVYPLWILRGKHKCRIVIAPRGMLQRGALAIKAFKKRMYLAVLKQLISMSKILWHVTNEHEAVDLKIAVNRPEYTLLGNIPCFDPVFAPEERKMDGLVKFGTIALISPMKNIHLVLGAMKLIRHPLSYTLFGPVKDIGYWETCQKLIEELPDHITFRYGGDLPPTKTARTIAAFNYYIQPSVSENFGHSIFEAFNAGIPVIISDKTPWTNLREQEAGWDVGLSEPMALQSAIEEALGLDGVGYMRFRKGARKIADRYMNEHDLHTLYIKLLQAEDGENLLSKA